MHIGLCSPDWPPTRSANGIVSYVAAVRDHFVAEGHAVSVISRGRLFPSDGPAVDIAPQPRASGRIGSIARRIRRRMDRSRGALPEVGMAVAREVAAAQRIRPLDIVEMEESFGWSEIVGRVTGIPVVTRLHGPYFLSQDRNLSPEQERANRSRCDAEARAVRAAAALTAPTRAIMDATCAHYERPPQKSTAIIPNPIRVAPPEACWQLATCERDHILMVGRFDYGKGADTMLMAFERLLERRPSARLTLVGPDLGIEITPGHAIGFEAYARAALSPRTRERVTFTGLLQPDEIKRLRLTANVTVISSRGEVFPYVLLEGLAAGCPMLSTAWPGCDEILTHGETGLLTPVGQPGPMAEKLEWLLSNPEAAARIGAAGREHCARAFSVDVVGGRLLDYYRTALRIAGT